MIQSIDNLKAGIRRWHELKFPPDLLNAEYHTMYKSRDAGVTQQWWSSAVDRLGQWRAYRGPSPPNSHYDITQLGLACLPDIAAEYARLAGKSARAGIKDLAPHDLRRTCARLCHLAGGELEQIQFLLGHASVQTTEQYLGCKQRLNQAVNDNLGLEDT